MRFHPHTEKDRSDMLAKIGAANVDELYSGVASDVARNLDLGLPNGKTELETERVFANLASKNKPANDCAFFLGAGTYYHHIPATVDYIIQRSEFLTSYTPYQPEVSQGTLQVIFEFQSMIAALTGMEIANASMYDGATSLAEAVLMAKRITKKSNAVVRGKLHPHYHDVCATYLDHIGGEISDGEIDENTACVIIQRPDFYGESADLTALKKQCEEAGCLLVVAITEIVSLGLLPAPVEADIVVGECQSLGIPMMFGGPHAGFFACSKKHVRQMPGRLCGLTEDMDGKRSYVLTLNTREQHIRRDKATSNICTNQGLCALAFTVHLTLLGEIGFKKLAQLNHSKAIELSKALEAKGHKILNKTFFNEFVVEVPSAKEKVEQLAEKGIIAGLAVEEDKLLITATEMVSDDDIKKLAEAL